MKQTIKKIMAPVLVLLIILSVITVCPVSVSAVTSGNYEYQLLEDGTAEITKYTGSDMDLTIPSKIDKYTATSISKDAFNGNTTLVNITIPDNITNIKDNAFYNCKSLENIYVSEDNSVYTSVDGILFNKDLTEIIKSPEGKRRTKYVIPDSVTKISDYAFYNNEKLINVTFPKSVTNVGFGAFDNTAWYNDQMNGVVYAGKVAYSFKGQMPQNAYVALQQGTKGITDSTFAGYTELTGISIPDSVTNIGKSAFSGCTGLTSLIIPDNVTSIGDSAFYKCTNLASITIPDGITNIGASVFAYTGLTEITIPNSVTSIGDNAFSYCENLGKVTISNGVTNIGVNAFLNCTKLKNVKIPANVKNIGKNAFGYGENENNIFKVDGFTISGYNGTAAETYANENEIKFISLDEQIVIGDADGDGELTVRDATYIQLYLANLLSEDKIDLTVCDVYEDDDINIRDVTNIQLQLANLI